MIYKPKTPDEYVNTSQKSFILQAIKLSVFLIISILIIYAVLTISVKIIVSNISLENEKKIFKYMSSNKFKYFKSNKNLTKIAKNMSKCINIEYDFEVYVSDERYANAFALPGGTIYITNGMLKLASDENQIASIIGHEIGHFKNRDHLESYGNLLIMMFFNVLLDDSFDLIKNTLNLGDAQYSQSAEYDADKTGLELMQCAYGNVINAKKIFEKMNKNSKSHDSFFSSHPAFKDRLNKMDDIIKEQNMTLTGKVVPLKW